jgi:hypothetical protein
MSGDFRASLVAAALVLCCGPASAADDPAGRAPTPREWAALAALPDWSGVWTPDIDDQFHKARTDIPPWTPKVAAEMAAMAADEKAGKPHGIFENCLPEGMPSWMLVSHNALEFLFTPGRVTLLGESDGGRLRRIYTDGRGHSADPDPSFHGESIGHWVGDALVVDTIGVLPETYIATGEALGVPNDGDLHVVERIHLAAPDILHDDLEITDPHVLAAPWRTTRIYYRHRGRKNEIVEGECLQGSFNEAHDPRGHAVFAPVAQDQGNVVPSPK